MVTWHLGWLEEQPNMRVTMNWESYRVGDMTRDERLEYARLAAEKDVNRAIHSYNRNIAVEKARTGEAL